MALGSFCMLSYTSIFSVQSAVHLSVYRLVCLSVGLSVTPRDCLPAWLFTSVCVPTCTSIYPCLYLSFGLSINKSIHQFVCSVSMSICLCSSIHLEFLPTIALLSLTCSIFNKWIARFLFSPWNSLKLLKSSFWTKHTPQGQSFSPFFPRMHHFPSSQVLPRGWIVHDVSTIGSQALPKLSALPEWFCSCIILEWIFTGYLLCARPFLRWWAHREIHSSCPYLQSMHRHVHTATLTWAYTPR